MNKNFAAERRLVKDALAAVSALGLKGRAIKPEGKALLGADAAIELTHGGITVTYLVEAKSSVTQANLAPVVHHLRRYAEKPLLITRHVSPPVAMQLRHLGVEFLDTAGNASLNRGGLFVWVKGEKPAVEATPPALGRAFQPSGLQVLFTLLCKPETAGMPYRDLADMSGVALGTVQLVIKNLEASGHVRDKDGRRGTRRLFEPENLLRQWVEAYARVLRPKTLLGRYFAPTLHGWEQWDLAKLEARWGGEPAGALMSDQLRPEEFTIYADKLPAMLIARHKMLKVAEPGHAVVVDIRKRFWRFDGDETDQGVVPSVLVYADLLATGDARCAETAGLIYGDYIAGSFR